MSQKRNFRQVNIQEIEDLPAQSALTDIHFRPSDLKNHPNFPKKILNEFENINYTASRKKRLTAQQVAIIICRENQHLFNKIEVIEIIKAWETDRKELQAHRKSERISKK